MTNIDNKINIYLNELYGDISSFHNEVRLGSVNNNKNISISSYEGKFLSILISILNPKNILEIGTFNGYSTIWLSRNLSDDARITTLEFDSKRAEIAESNFIKFNLKNVNIINIDARNYKPLENERFDFVFIDANKNSYKYYFDTFAKYLDKGGVIVVDNVLFHGDVVSKKTKIGIKMDKFNNYVRSLKNFDSVITPSADGLMIARKLY